ncbi:putative metalloprotease CJM1_0395 family protein [Catenovulum sp. 2E275]|uniref:putative metalloprotease CJM1_0395 family protein n=1 Tax=Catenovulum sp. 2E275 TaxID=2980497 RepID=UPI0021D0D199|nr:putative metalloprotease CJM1_0395 family protein [Catenovulum sp. 2E275]MCU4677633.1 putative metalloprotease CJM1_0395 family protein [Catenovulum sp. 2E275]
MNIVTQFPVNLNLNFANPQIEAARKEALSREAISQAAENEQSPSEAGTGSENERTTKRGLQQALTYDFSKPEQHRQENRQALDASGQNSTEHNQQDATEDQSNRGKEFTQSQNSSTELSDSEQKELEELKARDQEVRTHEQAHANMGGQHAGSPSYEFERGSDGKNYAVSGEVQIDVSEVAGDPQATIQKMEQVKRAALAPAEPSSADRKVANEASQKAQQARADLLSETTDTQQVKSDSNTNSINPTDSVNQVTTPSAQTSQSVAGIFVNSATQAEPTANITTQAVPTFEPKQTLAQSQTESLKFEQRDEIINARALKIERFYQQSYSPSETNFTRYA